MPGILPEDRGYQFADGVYEVCAVRSGRLLDEARHLDRLEYSLAALDMPMPMSRAALQQVMRETLRRNRIQSGILYIALLLRRFYLVVYVAGNNRHKYCLGKLNVQLRDDKLVRFLEHLVAHEEASRLLDAAVFVLLLLGHLLMRCCEMYINI
ncbi:MAG: aminotransferase class IV [Parvibaculales bacterium]